MTRRERTRILIQGRPELRREFAARIAEAHRVYTVAEPAQGLVMTRMRDASRHSRFYLGEVLVTEAKVQIAGKLGLGITTDEDEQAAHDLAVIDAAFHAGLEEADAWIPRLEAEAAHIAERESREDARVLETRVDFQTMDAD